MVAFYVALYVLPYVHLLVYFRMYFLKYFGWVLSKVAILKKKKKTFVRVCARKGHWEWPPPKEGGGD